MGDSLKKVMVFGAFDHFHKGHINFLEQAEKEGESLIVVLTPDNVVLKIKNRLPDKNFEKRGKKIKEKFSNAQIVAGDEKQGSWEVIKKYNPELIILGYDQKILGGSLKKFLPKSRFKNLEIKYANPYQPEKYQSRFIREPRKTLRISGKIQSGKGEANILGFPTINLPLNTKCESGIYSGRVHLHGKEYRSAIYVGPEKDIIEAHVLDFNKKDELYGDWATIEIEEKIREVVRTKSLQELKELIKKDVEKVKAM